MEYILETKLRDKTLAKNQRCTVSVWLGDRQCGRRVSVSNKSGLTTEELVTKAIEEWKRQVASVTDTDGLTVEFMESFGLRRRNYRVSGIDIPNVVSRKQEMVNMLFDAGYTAITINDQPVKAVGNSPIDVEKASWLTWDYLGNLTARLNRERKIQKDLAHRILKEVTLRTGRVYDGYYRPEWYTEPVILTHTPREMSIPVGSVEVIESLKYEGGAAH